MPVLVWSAIAGLGGLVSGLLYESESNKKLVENTGGQSFGFWDKTLMVGAGIAAYWIYRTTK